MTAAIAALAIPNARQTTFRERDRATIPGIESSGYCVVVESFSETANAGRIATIRFDLRRFDNLPGAPWRIVAFDRLTLVDGLYKLSLDESTQYSIDNLRLTGEDVEIAVDRGEAFVAMTPDGITALVILGNGTMTFSPRPEAEQVQVKLFSGKSTLVAPFSVAWIRLNPQDVRDRVNANALVPRPVDRQQFEKARAVFTEEVSRSFSLDLSDLSRDTWTLIPGFGDLLTTVRTRKYGELTYTHSNNEAEDISLFKKELGELWPWLCSKLDTFPKLPFKGKTATQYAADEEASQQLYEEGLEFQTNFNVNEQQVKNKLRRDEQIIEFITKRHNDDLKKKL